MSNKNNRLLAIGGLVSLLLTLGLIYARDNGTLGQWLAMNSKVPVFQPLNLLSGSDETERESGYYIFKDEQGKTIHMTALPVFVGDEYIADDNKHYRVEKVEGDVVKLKYIGQEKLAYNPAWDEPMSLPAQAGGGKKPLIAIYHSHSDESYVPTDGRSSIYGNGGIYKVGKAYAAAMKQIGLNVVQSLRKHDPHDANAYHRSRRTATELLKLNPVALVDVHRDAVPPDVYQAKINGKNVTQIKLVVGRRNPRKGENLTFAKNIKAYLDKHRPGLVEGIFIAKGNYNQDLSPRAILIEVGSHTNSRIQAQEGVKLFADAVPRVVGVSTTTGPGAAPPGAAAPDKSLSLSDENRGSWTGAFLAIVLVIAAGIGFLLLATGSGAATWDRLRNFASRELASALGLKKKENKGGEKRE
ncbi:stage II sporulation protein P [Carboxydocella sp. ULO1]|uniref:stage II sporulation protein P n=1 Tax=Carboxydocella sp. ULO1 TaxID=1926599 RepID=UPI0009ACBDFA|nr:stage II sporulation protein P [Carboxydocella sp. ULO1]GAW29765.1 Stage II sporulation protein P [Carboxydocella sp. ULO1]